MNTTSQVLQVDQNDIASLWEARPLSQHLLEQRFAYLVSRFREEHRTDAYFGLRRAIKAYNPTANDNFEAFAHIYLKGAILDGKRRDAHFTRRQFEKFSTKTKEIDSHYKLTGEKMKMDLSSFLPFVGSTASPFTQSDDSGTIADSIGSTACMGDNEFAIRLALMNLDSQEQEVCNLFLDGFTANEVQTKAKIKYATLVNTLVNISEKLSDIDRQTNSRYDSFSDAARAVTKTAKKENRTSLRDTASAVKALPIYSQFSFMEKKIIALIEGGMSLLEIARVEKNKPHIITTIWENVRLCLTEDGLAVYKARLEKKIEKKKRWRDWQLGHMEKIQKTKWEVFREKYPIPTKRELARDLSTITISQISQKYHIDDSNIHDLVRKYELEHIRNGKRILTVEGKASRAKFQQQKWEAGRPSKEEFAKDLQEMDWAQLTAKYGRSKYALTKYAKEMEIFHLKCDRDYETARSAGQKGMASLKKKIADQYGKENVSLHWTTSGISTHNRPKRMVIKNRKPSLKELLRRADRSFEEIATEFSTSPHAIRCLYREYKIMSERYRIAGEKRGYQIQLDTFKQRGVKPPTAEQLIEWFNTLSWGEIKTKHGMERNSFWAYARYINCKLPNVKPVIYTESAEVRKERTIKTCNKKEALKRLSGEMLPITKEAFSADIQSGMGKMKMLAKYHIGKERFDRFIKEFGLELPDKPILTEEQKISRRLKLAKTRGLPPFPSKEQLIEDIKNCSTLTEVGKKYSRTRGSITFAIKQWNLEQDVREVNPKIANRIQSGIEAKRRGAITVFPEMTKDNLEKDVATMSWYDIARKYGAAINRVKKTCNDLGIPISNRPKKISSNPNAKTIRDFRLFQKWERKRLAENPNVPNLPPYSEFIAEFDSSPLSEMAKKYQRSYKSLRNYRNLLQEIREKDLMHLFNGDVVQKAADTVQNQGETNAQ